MKKLYKRSLLDTKGMMVQAEWITLKTSDFYLEAKGMHYTTIGSTTEMSFSKPSESAIYRRFRYRWSGHATVPVEHSSIEQNTDTVYQYGAWKHAHKRQSSTPYWTIDIPPERPHATIFFGMSGT